MHQVLKLAHAAYYPGFQPFKFRAVDFQPVRRPGKLFLQSRNALIALVDFGEKAVRDAPLSTGGNQVIPLPFQAFDIGLCPRYRRFTKRSCFPSGGVDGQAGKRTPLGAAFLCPRR
ncbi:MAG: hypothetical protein EPO20_12000 [Betaproteobacteria bacterium]|nr:MAG: hypothetical protein EPO20_12000 [Betaproteobacteria bacterium]